MTALLARSKKNYSCASPPSGPSGSTALRCLFPSLLLATALAAQTVEFNREIRPILSDKCYTCHGPDASKRNSKLRFDTEAGAKADLGGHLAIVPGDAAKSEMLRRISTDDTAKRMPPAYSGAAKLSAREIDTVRRWIEQGAKWQGHWSFISPKRPPLPAVSNQAWPRNAIDHFILERLGREGLKPSPEAPKTSLIRRATFDLTGLPATPSEIDAYLADSAPNAYERMIDRLLASPRYGERMAVRWLDAARYADTSGYQSDGERSMWRWRDWVIEAYNNNMPFDRFTVEQIAGDMLPNATLDQRIATGFNRNHRGNSEGGIVPEEYAVEYVVDRVDTTSTVFLGLTLGCARCHNHKYDPLTQKEYYQLFAAFNNIPEFGRASKYDNSPPYIPAPTREQEAKLKALEPKVAAAGREWVALGPELERTQRAWELTLLGGPSSLPAWAGPEGLLASFPLDEEAAGPSGRAANFDGTRTFEGGNTAAFGFLDKFTLSAWINPSSPDGAIVNRVEDKGDGQGYALILKAGKLQANMVVRWLDDSLRVESVEALPLNRWSHVALTYDGSRVASGVGIYVNGAPVKIKVLLDELNQSFNVKKPFRVGGGGVDTPGFRGAIDEVHVYKTALTPDEVSMISLAASAGSIAAVAPAVRTRAQSMKLASYFLHTAAPAHIQQAWKRFEELRKQKDTLVAGFSTVMVMQESPRPRDTFVLVRGAYDRPGDKVTVGVPAVLHRMPADAPGNRLGLAKWLVSPDNPLTARVNVNRFWQMYFGTGLVKTTEDFGSQGEWPSHPELLDWLATEFVASGWDVKAMQKTIMMSAAYRQSSKVTPELIQRDPENRLLARGPRYRLPAEAVRDQALSVSGLLVEKLGGKSVKPYQPKGLWKEMASGDYEPDTGDKLYRRSLYTFWKRTIAPPSMMTFDAAGREACTVRETRTNTPLQALTLMNDVTYLEASRMLAERMLAEGGATPADRIAFAFRLATARYPSPEESRILKGAFHRYLDRHQTDRAAALKLLKQGEHSRNENLDAGEHAAYTTVASLILNLDETVTKE